MPHHVLSQRAVQIGRLKGIYREAQRAVIGSGLSLPKPMVVQGNALAHAAMTAPRSLHSSNKVGELSTLRQAQGLIAEVRRAANGPASATPLAAAIEYAKRSKDLDAKRRGVDLSGLTEVGSLQLQGW